MSMEYIRRHYGVPARRGAPVEYREPGKEGAVRRGKVVSAGGSRLRIRFDGETKTHPAPFHPTWNLTWPGSPEAGRE